MVKVQVKSYKFDKIKNTNFQAEVIKLYEHSAILNIKDSTGFTPQEVIDLNGRIVVSFKQIKDMSVLKNIPRNPASPLSFGQK